MTKHKQNTMKNLTVLKTLTHPKAKLLKVDIIKIESDNNISYCYDYDGDWYDFDWCENPLNECIEDAKSMLNEKYNGTYYNFNRHCSEKIIFNTCTY